LHRQNRLKNQENGFQVAQTLKRFATQTEVQTAFKTFKPIEKSENQFSGSLSADKPNPPPVFRQTSKAACTPGCPFLPTHTETS